VVDTRGPRISPSYADPGRFPKNLLIITTEQDPIEGEKLAEEVRMEGHNVVCHRMEGCMHGRDNEAKRGSREWKAKEKAYGYAADMLRIRESSCDPDAK
jgi:acetyl esterase/lipase